MSRISHPIPPHYVTPDFPSLVIPKRDVTEEGYFLYNVRDIWRFTVLWTLIIYGLFYFAASAYALMIQWRRWRLMSIVMLAYLIVAGIEAVIAGSAVGLILGGTYRAGQFRMSTWVPLIWSLINVLVLILSSFSIQGAL